MVPSYKTNEWQVLVRYGTSPDGDTSTSTVQIRALEDDEWHDYWVPQDPANRDFVQYQEWLAEGNEPRIVF